MINENNNKINWDEINLKIKNLKYPFTFIFKLFKNSEKFSDNNLSLIIRYFLKYNYNSILQYRLLNLLNLLNQNKVNSRRIITDFYFLIRKKVLIALLLKKWRISYNKNNFWNLDIEKQIENLHKLKNIFMANFEVTRSNILFHHKINCILRSNNVINREFHLNIIIKRLRNIFLIFGRNFFKNNKILIMKIGKFNNFSLQNKIKYCDYLFSKINKILFKTINYFLIYNSIQKQLNSIINPKPVVFISENNNIETQIQDILFIIEN
jgi:hypothetical protein